MKDKLYDILTKYQNSLLYNIIQWVAAVFFGFILGTNNINIINKPIIVLSLIAIFILCFRLFMYKYFVYLLHIIDFLKKN